MFALLYFGESGAVIKDSLFATVGNKAITRSDILAEIKIILILNGQNFSQENAEILETSAIKTTIQKWDLLLLLEITNIQKLENW